MTLFISSSSFDFGSIAKRTCQSKGTWAAKGNKNNPSMYERAYSEEVI
jgi:hypothetical protein